MRPIPVVLLLCAILLAGCDTPKGRKSQGGVPYIVNSERALFYSYGPAQTTGPDFALSHGQQVKMLNYDYGYSRVSVDATGQVGYVPTEDLIPLPPSARSSPSPSPGAARRRRAADSFWSRPPTPAEQSTVPLPEFPETEPKPGSPPFRY